MSAVICPRRYCGTVLDFSTDGSGRVVATCAMCARNKAGRCRACPKPLDRPKRGGALYCRVCSKRRKRLRDRAHDRARYPKRRAAVLAHHRKRQAIPAIREHRRRYMQAYRQSHPRDDTDRLVMRLYMRQRRSDPAYRAAEAIRKRGYRLKAKQRRQAA